MSKQKNTQRSEAHPITAGSPVTQAKKTAATLLH